MYPTKFEGIFGTQKIMCPAAGPFPIKKYVSLKFERVQLLTLLLIFFFLKIPQFNL